MGYDGISATIWGREKIKCGNFPLNHDLRMFIPYSELSIAQPGLILRLLRGLLQQEEGNLHVCNLIFQYLWTIPFEFPCAVCRLLSLLEMSNGCTAGR